MSINFTGPVPTPTPTTEPFWQGLEEDKIFLQQCDDCQQWIFYPRSNCSACLSTSLTWKQVSGDAEIYSFTIARRPTAPQFAGMEPQYIAVVSLAEGVRMNTMIVDCSEDQLCVGLKLKPVFHRLEEQTLLFFTPV